MNKKITVEEAVSKIKSGMTIMVGGFLSNGSANKILDAIAKSDISDITIITNDTSFPDKGVGKLLERKQIKKVIASHIGTNELTQQQMNAGEIEVEFVPQGTLAERVRAGGFGLGGFLTPTGLGTIIAEGKQIINVDGKDYLLEKPLHADVALVGASKGDESGNLVYYGTSKNFNPMMASAADLVIAEIDEIVPVGTIRPEDVHTPAIMVDYIVA
ncbi:MAG: CoA transferase subunit A [Prevotellaceae bacterium]|jgi:acetate CoA/acetoacetate CoA-transferase alpha subunit|nr:CoA transferase subunit A [Prevotellaceae bacterium]